MIRRGISAFAGFLALIAGASTSDASTVDTTPSWNGANSISPWGDPHTATYGQTVTAPGGENSLNSFSVYIFDNIARVTYSAYVYSWDGTKATGPALFHSASFTTPGGNTGTFIETTFNTDGTPVTPGNQYILFLSYSGLAQGPNTGTTSWGYLSADVYAGGGFWFRNSGDDFSLLTSSSWENVAGGGVQDLAFKATFGSLVAVPEPASMALFGAGLLGLCLMGRRRRA